jgi:hypothetical protein
MSASKARPPRKTSQEVASLVLQQAAVPGETRDSTNRLNPVNGCGDYFAEFLSAFPPPLTRLAVFYLSAQAAKQLADRAR